MNGYPTGLIFLFIFIGGTLMVLGISIGYELMWRAVRRGMLEYDKKKQAKET